MQIFRKEILEDLNNDIKTIESEKDTNKVIYKDYIKTDSEHIQVCERSENDDSNIIDMSNINISINKIIIKTATIMLIINST